MTSVIGYTELQWSSYDGIEMGRLIKESWYQAKMIQGNPRCNIIRMQQDGKVPHAIYFGGTVSNTATGGTLLPCTVSTYKKDEIATSFGAIVSSDRRLVVYDFEIKLKDIVEFPAGSGKRWKVMEVEYSDDTGRCVAQIRVAQT